MDSSGTALKYREKITLDLIMRKTLVLTLFTLAFLLLLTNCNFLLYYPSDRVYNEELLAKYDASTITSKSGNTLHTVYLSKKEDPAKALIVHFHGNARNITAHYRAFAWTLDYGYDLLSWDYSGYGQSSGRPTPDNLFKDSQTILEYAVSLKKKNNYRLIVIGQSLGGAVLLGALEQFQDLEMIDMIVVDCTFSSFKKIANYHVKNSIVVPIPLGTISISDRYAPKNNPAAIKDRPILVSHCREDEVIPFQFGTELYEQLVNEKKWFWELSCKHTAGYWKDENRERLMSFFDEELFKK